MGQRSGITGTSDVRGPGTPPLDIAMTSSLPRRRAETVRRAAENDVARRALSRLKIRFRRPPGAPCSDATFA